MLPKILDPSERGSFRVILWFTCPRVCMFCFVSRALCVPSRGDTHLGVCSPRVQRIPLRAQCSPSVNAQTQTRTGESPFSVNEAQPIAHSNAGGCGRRVIFDGRGRPTGNCCSAASWGSVCLCLRLCVGGAGVACWFWEAMW